jgi:hypothetical protein
MKEIKKDPVISEGGTGYLSSIRAYTLCRGVYLLGRKHHGRK